MEISPQRVRSAEFKSIRKGVDPDEVKAFLDDVADELERAQNQSTAMEARARAAVARLQELSEGGAVPASAEGAAETAGVHASVDESETISRTLLLAQRTADSTVADAEAQAEQILTQAKAEAARTLDSTREMSASMLEEARAEARQVSEAERAAVASEVEALKARRDFLESDVQHLETFLVDQRARLRDAATSITEIVDRVPGGLAEVRAPLLSAADDDTGELPLPEPPESSEPARPETFGVTDISEPDISEPETPEPETALDETPLAGSVGEPQWGEASVTDGNVDQEIDRDVDRDVDEEFRFSFDDERS